MPGFNIKNAKKDLDSKDENCAKLGAADFLYERSSPLADLDSVRSYRWLFNLFDPFKSDTLGNTKVKQHRQAICCVILKKPIGLA
jgi:hypothetical protein